jgi:hypothetical protein
MKFSRFGLKCDRSVSPIIREDYFHLAIFGMEIKRKFTFTGVFKKLHEEDTHPTEILDANIYCYVDGNIFLEIDFKVRESINYKRFFESFPRYQSEGITSEQVDSHLRSGIPSTMSKGALISEAYKGDYEIKGKTFEGWEIKASVADPSFRVTFRADDSENLEDENRYQIKLRNLYIDYKLDLMGEARIEKIVYGLTNIEIFRNFSANIANSDAEMNFKSASTVKHIAPKDILSAEMTLSNIHESAQKSNATYSAYSAWIIMLLSFASGSRIDKIYELKFVEDEYSQIRSEYWPGIRVRNEAGGIAIIQSPDLPLFIQQCATRLTWETFADQGLGLALRWYVNTFDNSIAEVNFLLLCTVLESLNKKHLTDSNTSKRLISTSNYRRIRDKIFNVLSEFKDEIENADQEKYEIFMHKVKKPFEDASYNQIGNLRASLKEMLEIYGVQYEDLFPGLEFIKVRDKLVHEGFGGLDVAIELRKLSNLVVRVFLSILKYQGDYMESIKIELGDEPGRSKHGLTCRAFPFITPVKDID